MGARAGAAYLSKKQWKKWYGLGADYAWGHSSVEGFRDQMKAKMPGVEWLGDTYAPIGTKDYSTYIDRIKAAKPDAIWVAIAGADAINFIKQAKAAGLMDLLQVCGEVMGDPTIHRETGLEGVGIIAGSRAPFMLNTPAMQEFVKRWEVAYNDVPGEFDVETYQAMMFMAKGMEKAGALEVDKVIAAFEGLSYDGPEGTLKMRKEDHQAEQGGFFGVVKKVDKYPFGVLTDIETFPADVVTPPVEGCFIKR
jgi:branched-chain amino acid transport system substrate-binding protein